MDRSQGFSNLIRLDANARVACAAASVRPDPGRTAAAWFQALKAGDEAVITRVAARIYSAEPAALIAVRASGADGRFAGALAAVIPLNTFKPDLADPSLPTDTQVGLADREGRYVLGAARDAFAPLPPSFTARPSPNMPAGVATQAQVFNAVDPAGQKRVFAVAPLLRDVSVVISAPDEGLFSWARLNPLSGLLFPIAAFVLALLAVWVVADRVIVQWLRYLDRIAAIYARGRFTVRPLQAERAPPEVRALAHTLDVMAEAIVARDQSLRDSLAQKDALMREIHHRVKNNLQVITSLLNMQQRSLTDPAARAAMSDTRQRIAALALIYRALYQGPDLRRVDLRSFLEELTAQVIASEGGALPAIRTDLEADALEVDPDKLAPIALFAVEAITNAQKHAFAPGGGVLHVRFTLGESEGCLEIEDEGGRGDPAFSEGMGSTLMTAFARQLRGRCEILPNAKGGVTARLVFPAADERGKPAATKPPSGPRGNQAAA
jgi:two-component sensor histidine kinase